MNGPSLSAKIFIQILKRAKDGSVEITFPDDTKQTFGDGGGPLIHATVKTWDVFDLLVRKGDLGLAEAVIEGDLIVDDMVALVEWACKNDQALGSAIQGRWYGTIVQKLSRMLTQNASRQAKKNIMAHYDLGNEFYRLWLDPSMTYSSAIFSGEDESLLEGQNRKYDRLIEGLNIKAGDHVLEIGCGWGGFFSRAVEKTGCKVTAVMNSPEQARHNQEMIQKKGMDGHIDLQQIDYRKIEGKFDKVVSIEMIEAVGEMYWPTYFSKVSASLKANGSAMIQGITIREDLFYSYRKNTDFIQQYVFPGGMLLTNQVFSEMSAKNEMNLSNVLEFPLSYAETLKHWRLNFQKALEEVRNMGFDEKFIRMWNLYLAYCEGAFRAQRISVGQFLIAK